MIPETTKVKVCSNNGSYTLSPWLEYLGKSNFAAIDVSWNRGNTDSSNWTNLFHLRDSICSMSKESSADCTWLRCSSDGKLIADHSGGRPTMKSARYLLEARLSNGSHVHHFYDVEFIECKYGFSISTTLRKQKNINFTLLWNMPQLYESRYSNICC